jgi:peroxiredoxin
MDIYSTGPQCELTLAKVNSRLVAAVKTYLAWIVSASTMISVLGCEAEVPAPIPAVEIERQAPPVEQQLQPEVNEAEPTPPPAAASREVPQPETPASEITRDQAVQIAPPEKAMSTEPAAGQLAASSPQPAAKEPIAATNPDEPQRRTVFYRADAAQPASIPPVVLSQGHAALCRVKAGDTMPAIELEQIGGGRKKLSELFGEKATVVVLWKSDRRMSHQLLVDIGPDVIQPFGGAGVAVVGIAVSESADRAQATLQKVGANFTNLLDADSQAFTALGSEKLPRVYLLDPDGKILWFDIEYSLGTRRELHQALRAVVAQ